MIRVLQALSEAGGAANEDLICCEPDLLMLLDGSTSLIPTDFDARRFTRGFAQGMRTYAELALPERVNRALNYTEALYRQSGAGSGEDFLEPELSLEEIYEKLRRAEALDPGFEAMPRFKPGDDASALVAELAEN